MPHLFLIATITVFFVFLLTRIWKSSHEFIFIVGFLLMYYWLILGSWFVIADQVFDAQCGKIGLQYYGISQKLFPVLVDHSYFLSILYHGLFIIIAQGVLLLGLKHKNTVFARPENPLTINHFILMFIAFFSVCMSFMIVKSDILFAVENNLSIYTVTRSHAIHFFSFHQLFNQIAVFSIYTGLAVFLSQKEGYYFRSNLSRIIPYLYFAGGTLIFSYIMLLGNKNEFLFSGLFAICLMYFNNGRRIQWGKTALLLFFIMVPLVLNYYFRVMGSEIVQQIFNITPSYGLTDRATAHASTGLAAIISSFVFSNEMFYAQFSMYGIIHFNLPYIWGQSFYSLFASFVPAFINASRPASAYEVYANGVRALPGQGYTISHAAAWFLNFGIAGIAAGASFFSFIWSKLYNKLLFINQIKKRFFFIFIFFAPLALFAFIPSLMRSGPEVYKAFIFEALLIPVTIFFIATAPCKLRINKRQANENK